MKAEDLKGDGCTVFAPATVANIGCGFDILGFALKNPGDRLSLKISRTEGIRIETRSAFDTIPAEPEKNTAGVAVQAMLDEMQAEFGVNLLIEKGLPAGSGLGSSAASAVSAVYALNRLLPAPYDNHALVQFALEGEKIASAGQYHADNVAPCLFGGIVLARSAQPPDIIELPVPRNLFCVIIHPHVEIKTAVSRRKLPEQIPLKTAVRQWGNIAGMISAFYRNDLHLLARSLEDSIAEPVRSGQIPHYDEIKQAALRSGAIGCNISGSGPSVFALTTGIENARRICASMEKILNENETRYDAFVSVINPNGAEIISVD